jgi:hypothetical protein
MIAKELNKDLSGLNSFRMRVRCRSFLEYDSIADIAALDFYGYAWAGETHWRWLQSVVYQ